MVNSFNCLWHYTIICSYNKNSNICSLSTTHSHSCKCFMTRSIKECNKITIYIYLVSTYLLCDSA